MSADIVRDSDGNVTIKPPTATGSGRARLPGVVVEETIVGAEAPEFIVHIHEGRPVLYERVKEP